MKKNKNYAKGELFGLTGVAFAFAGLVGFCIYGTIYDYFDTGVFAALVLAIISGVRMWSLPESLCLSFAVCLFFVNSFPVWADHVNNITMYASRGGLEPVIALIAVMLAGIVCAVIACFSGQRGGKES